eukprot:gene5272-7549_t
MRAAAGAAAAPPRRALCSCAAVLRRALRVGEPADERRRKEVAIPVILADLCARCSLLITPFVENGLASGDVMTTFSSPVFFWLDCAGVLVVVTLLATVVASRRLELWWMELYCLWSSAFIIT